MFAPKDARSESERLATAAARDLLAPALSLTSQPPQCQWEGPPLDGVRHHFVSVAGARIHYVEAGAGKPLVLLHGWPQHWWSFRKVIGPLAAKYRVICPDIRGLGWSGESTTPYRLVDLAGDLVGFLDALALERVHLVGHDWGAAIGYTTCLRWPRRVEKFVALGAVTPWSAEGSLLRLCLHAWHVFALALFGRWAIRVLRLPAYALRAWRRTGEFSCEEYAAYASRIHTPSARRATALYYSNVAFRELPYFVRSARALRLHTSTLHLNGDRDPLTRSVSDNHLQYADDMQLEWIADCGHFLPEEQPEALLDRLYAFLT